MRVALALAALAACSSPATTVPLSSGPTPSHDESGDARTRAALDIYPHVTVLRGDLFAEYHDVIAAVLAADRDEIVAADALAFVTLDLIAPVGLVEMDIEGVGPAKTRVRTDIEKYVTDGVLPVTATGTDIPVAVGDRVAKRLGVHLGDTVPARRRKDNFGRDLPGGPDPARTVRIVGILHTGIADIDDKTAFTTFAAAQELEQHGDVALAVALKLAHPRRAPGIAKRLTEVLGQPYVVTDWCQLDKELVRC